MKPKSPTPIQDAVLESLGIAGDDQVSRVRRRLIQPVIDDILVKEAVRLLAEAKAKTPVPTGALRRFLKP